MANLPPISNKLKSYPSYIYGLSLHMMTEAIYNACVESESYSPQNVIIASAGRHGLDFPRNKHFDVDFYFDDFNLTSVIGPNTQSRNSNAIDLNFTIIEPYGFTLFERLIRAANELGMPHYREAPYMLQIDFFAINDDGTIQGSIEDLVKRIPIKLIKVDMNISERGSTYKVTAVPYNHSAYEATSVSTPANFEITASTVQEFFQSLEGTDADTALNAAIVIGQQRSESAQPGAPVSSGTTTSFGPAGQANRSTNTIAAQTTNTGSAVLRAKSYGAAINAYNQSLAQSRKQKSYDVYRFEFAPDPETGLDVIGSAKFTSPEKVTPKQTKMSDDPVKMKRAAAGENQGTYDPNRVIFQINQGTTIEKLLEYIIRISSYTLDQVVTPDGLTPGEYQQRKDALKDKPLNWFKIIPKVRLLEFDSVRNTYSREITFIIKPYKVFNLKTDIGPQGVALSPSKAYNYIFTGKNDDVLDFDINFNMLHFIEYTAYRDNLTEITPRADATVVNYQDTNVPGYTGVDIDPESNANSVAPHSIKYVASNTKNVATGGATDALQTAAADLANNVLNSSEADLLNLKIKILGDPDYIKQDDVFYRPGTRGDSIVPSPDVDPRILPNNAGLAMDYGGTYVQVLFKTPRDYDENTGFLVSQDTATSVFSGLYQVITVSSNFSNGMFTQELNLVRLPRQLAYDYGSVVVEATNNRTESFAALDPVGIPVGPQITAPIEISGGAPRAQTTDSGVAQTPGSQQRVSQQNNTPASNLPPEQEALRNIRNSAPVEVFTNN